MVLAFARFRDLDAMAIPDWVNSPGYVASAVLSVVLMTLYFAVPEGLWGASLGKAIFGLRVVDRYRSVIGVPRAVLRAAMYICLPSSVIWTYWIVGGRFPFDTTGAHPGTSQPWGAVRYWLLELARELAAAEKDGAMPEELGLDRVWITAEGRAKLLDFPAPKTAAGGRFHPAVMNGSVQGAPQRLLYQVAASALEGRIVDGEKESLGQAATKLPLEANELLQRISNTELGEVCERLKQLVKRTSQVTRARRGMMMRAFAVDCVTRSGKPASRLRMLWRSIVFSAPVLLAPVLFAFVYPLVQNMTAAVWPSVGLVLAVVIGSCLLPRRGLADRLTGTYPVPS